MLHITLQSAFSTNPAEDELGRSRLGFTPDMTDEEVYEAGRASWILGARADRERYALLAHQGIVRLAIEIESLHHTPTSSDPVRRMISGRILSSGHPVHDAYVGGPALARHQNPVAYVQSQHDGSRYCACGCGEPLSAKAKGDFIVGHDQRAIAERVARVGTVRDFLRWFDEAYAA